MTSLEKEKVRVMDVIIKVTDKKNAEIKKLEAQKAELIRVMRQSALELGLNIDFENETARLASVQIVHNLVMALRKVEEGEIK